jgi:ribonuclease PH
VLDLDYAEDSNAEIDANFVIASGGALVEIQATGEERPFSQDEFAALLALAGKGCEELFALQRAAVG